MSKFDWKAVVKTVAPGVATALGGPLAGMAVKALGEKILGKSDATEDEVSAAVLSGNPELLLKLKEAEFAFMQSLNDAGIKLEEIAAADRASARDREVKSGDSWTPRILASIVIIGYFLVQWYVLKHVVAPEMRDIVLRSMGTLDMALGLVLGYYFGSSASGKVKDDTIAHIAKME